MKGKGRNWLFLLAGAFVFLAGCGGSGTSIWDPGVEEPIPIVDITGPRIIVTNPVNGATNVPVNSVITATFNEEMDAITIESPATTFTVTGPGGPVDGTVTYAGTTAVFTPDSDLSDTSLYTATVTSGAEDLAGNPLVAGPVPNPWTFTTGATRDETAPIIIFTNPVDGAVDVPIDQKVAATFSEVMDPTTLDTITFTLIGPSGPVTGRVDYAGTTAVFSPIDSLGADTNLAAGLYTALVTAGAMDLAGNPLVVPQTVPVPNSWDFTVGASPDDTAPIITYTDPVDDTNGDTPVAINHAVSATFSEPMNPATIIAGVTFILNEFDTGDTVLGTVSFVTNADTTIATFTPDSDLAENTHYIALITNLVEDLDGDTLVVPQNSPVPDPWEFWTGTDTELYQGQVDLGLAGTFGIMATASTNSTGPSVINGDVAVSPGNTQNIPPAQINGEIHVADGVAAAAYVDLLTAYNYLKGLASDDTTPTTDLGAYTPAGSTLPPGTLPPGVYTNGSTMTVEANSPVTLDAGGDANAVWVFQIGSSLTTTNPGGDVLLINGAQAKNVFWVPTASATIGSYTTFNGTIVAGEDISGLTYATINGRLLAGALGAGNIVLDSNTVNVPAP